MKSESKELYAELYLTLIKKEKAGCSNISFEVRVKLAKEDSFNNLYDKKIITGVYNSDGLDFTSWACPNFRKEDIKAELNRLQEAGFDIYWNKLDEVVAQLI